MGQMFHKLPLWSLLCLVVFVVCGCQDENAPKFAKSVRTEEVKPPVEAPPPELLAAQRAFIEVSTQVTPAVVNIRAERITSTRRLGPLFEDFFGDLFQQQPTERREQSLGSGFLISPDGYILTNEHVISAAEKIKVRLPDRTVLAGEVIGVDPKTDVAVIKVEAETPLPTVVLGDSDNLKVGQWALAIGNPFGLDSTLTVGVISATGRTNVGIEDYEDFIQTDASINPGNSGGPLLNIHGEVVGINTAIVASGQGIGFAIPINLASMIAEQLITDGKVTRGWLGVTIQPLDAELAKSFGLENVTGALVTQVIKDTPAARAGLQRGDVLLTFDGKPIRGVRELQLLVASSPIGQEASIEILRNGSQLTLGVTIVARKDDPVSTADRPGTEEPVKRWLGMTFEETEAGLSVTSVADGSPAALGGVQSGDLLLAINQRDVLSLNELRKQMDQLPKQGNVLLFLQRGNAHIYIALPLED